jgi:hypothetical protein
MVDKDPNETYTDHAVRLLREMGNLETDNGKPTWQYDLIVALAHSHSNFQSAEILKTYSARAERVHTARSRCHARCRSPLRLALNGNRAASPGPVECLGPIPWTTHHAPVTGGIWLS